MGRLVRDVGYALLVWVVCAAVALALASDGYFERREWAWVWETVGAAWEIARRGERTDGDGDE